MREVRDTPCNDCPWRRRSLAGWLGGNDPDWFLHVAHSDEPYPCHLDAEQEQVDNGITMLELCAEGVNGEGPRQCAGLATYRGNVHKRPRDRHVTVLPADHERVFATPVEFKEHHMGEGSMRSWENCGD